MTLANYWIIFCLSFGALYSVANLKMWFYDKKEVVAHMKKWQLVALTIVAFALSTVVSAIMMPVIVIEKLVWIFRGGVASE